MKPRLSMGRFLRIDDIPAMVAALARAEYSFSTEAASALSGGRGTS
jgi:hypothetical protein